MNTSLPTPLNSKPSTIALPALSMAAFWPRVTPTPFTPLAGLALNDLQEVTAAVKLESSPTTQRLKKCLTALTQGLEAVNGFIEAYNLYKADTSGTHRMPITSFLLTKSHAFTRATNSLGELNSEQGHGLDEKANQLIVRAIKRGQTAADLIKDFYNDATERDRAFKLAEQSLHRSLRSCAELSVLLKACTKLN